MSSGTDSSKLEDRRRHDPLMRLDGLRARVPAAGIDSGCILVILTIATVFLAPALRPDHTLLPLQWVSRLLPWSEYINEPLQNTTLGDPFFAFYPRRHFFIEAIRSGEMPFWNRYMLAGYPAVGDTNAQTFYPFNWLAAAFLSPARSFPILAWFHLTLTGALMFGMLRSYKLRRASSLLGAISWMLSGILIVWLEHPHRLSSFAWLPGVFWAYSVGNQRRRLELSILAGILFALMILGGQPQYAALGGLLLGSYAVAVSVRSVNGRLHLDRWSLVSLTVVAFIGLGIGSLQLLPTWEFLTQSHRRTSDMQMWLFSALPLRHIATFWLPDLFGSAEVGKPAYWGQTMNYVEYTFYFGILPLLLSVLAPVTNRKRKRVIWLWVAVVVVTVLAAVGSPLAHVAQWIPGMTYFALHRTMSHVPFLGAWLAALALDGVLDRPRESRGLRWALICAAGMILATGVVLYACRLEARYHWDEILPHLLRQGGMLTLGILGLIVIRRRQHMGAILLLGITVIDLFLWGHTFNPISSLDLLYPENDVTHWLKQDHSLYRVLPLRHGKRIFGENVLSVFDIGTPDGYLALMLRHHKELMYTIDPYYDDERRRLTGPHNNLIVAQDFHPLHSMLNVKYVLSSVPLEAPRLRRAVTFDGVRIYENQDVLPRAYVVHRARAVPEERVLNVLASSDWDYRKEILISKPLTPEQQTALDASPAQDDSTARIAEYSHNRVRLTATMEHPGLLVLADPFSSGWHALADGQPAEVLRANHDLRAIFLKAGRHDVEFYFLPRSVVISAAIAIGTSLVSLVLLAVNYRKRELPKAP